MISWSPANPHRRASVAVPVAHTRLVGTLLVTLVGACADDAGTPMAPPAMTSADGGGAAETAASLPPRLDASPGDTSSPNTPVDPAVFGCPEVPTAYVFEHHDGFTNNPGSGAALLSTAGFEVRPLPLDRNPTELRGLIFIGSFATENPAFRDYLSRNARALYTFVDAANVLLEMPQADQTEQQPPFLPNSQSARRHDIDVDRLLALDPQHPLLAGVALAADGSLAWKAPLLGWETFSAQSGFAVLLAAGMNGENAALMEGAYAQGRFLLSAVPADKPVALGPERDAFNRAFFQNLLAYTRGVCRRQTRAVNVTPSPGRPVFGAGSSVIAVLPDTQYYTLNFPGIFFAQTSWLATNAQRLRIPYVFHLGDIVDQNTPLEWQRAAQAMSLLDGTVPYALATGNHDFGASGNATTRETLMNEHFSFDRHAAMPTFGGAYQPGRLENTFHRFSMGGRDYVVLALEWGPRNEVIAWADQVMAANPGHFGILITHAYLNNNDRRYDITDAVNPQDFNPHQYGTAGGVNDGEELWQKLVRRHPFVMTFNGHVLGDGTGYLASVTDRGNICHQILANYQFRAQGGEGYLRLLEFLEDGTTVKVHSYSPLYDSYLTEPDQAYSFKLDVPLGPPN
jgi:hypothetical protein